MSLMSPLVLLAALTAGPIDNANPLPATCLKVMPVERPHRPRRRGLLPSVVLGFEYAPTHTGRTDGDDDLPSSPGSTYAGASAANRDQHRSLSRWTVSLRWQSRTTSSVAIEPLPSAYSPICNELVALRTERPSSLDEAIDHWSRTARLQALIDLVGEGHHD